MGGSPPRFFLGWALLTEIVLRWNAKKKLLCVFSPLDTGWMDRREVEKFSFFGGLLSQYFAENAFTGGKNTSIAAHNFSLASLFLCVCVCVWCFIIENTHSCRYPAAMLCERNFQFILLRRFRASLWRRECFGHRQHEDCCVCVVFAECRRCRRGIFFFASFLFVFASLSSSLPYNDPLGSWFFFFVFVKRKLCFKKKNANSLLI